MATSPAAGLKKPQVYESRKIQLTSPLLHIGGAVSQLNPFEFVQSGNKVYLPNQEALAKALLAKGGRFLDDYIATIEERQDIRPLLVQAFGKEWWTAKDEAGNRVFPEETISHKWTDDNITTLRPMIRNGMGQLYIPGSSIKGAIRTAIAYYLLKNADTYQIPAATRVSAIEATLIEKLGKLNNHKKNFFDDDLFMDSLFSDFTLTYQGRHHKLLTNSENSSSNTDFLRALKVSDSTPLIESKAKTKQGKIISVNLPVVGKVIISSRDSDYSAKYRASIYAEMVCHVKAEFTLTLDTEMLSWFTHNQGIKLPFSNLDELLQICREFAQDQWKGEHDYWEKIQNNDKDQKHQLNFDEIRKFYMAEKCSYNLRLGWGCGMNGTTVDFLFQEETRQQIRDMCGLKAPGYEAPKSRRTIVDENGDIKFVPGWVKFKTLEAKSQI
ncbi:MAG TPA: type III-A CRISPR-associated RAMP protein Csm5 [Oscillatoriaceae cyanobacterium M33_DOE_052]|uniref:CRISPR system Cms protein Csm5 n=1 Tax=Planktothricoides sp. SpSt-374 TaxID=2282167 RepID=A0A7C3VI41_9CYAN|nr:type III-A CRISPR-associated RAMP protein Csm5 [Oscillatoriaceae cyanobacterium M33_DOE_052]